MTLWYEALYAEGREFALCDPSFNRESLREAFEEYTEDEFAFVWLGYADAYREIGLGKPPLTYPTDA